MKKLKLFILFISLTSTGLFAQIISEEDIKLFQEADLLMSNDQFSDALPLYLRLNKKDSINPDLNYLIGVCYMNSATQKTKAIGHLIKATACIDVCTLKDDKAHFMAISLLGDAYHLACQFELAIETYERFKMQLSQRGDKEMLETVNRKIEMCKTGKKLMYTPVDVKIENMGSAINSEYAEYSPVLTADESTIIFTTRRPNSTGRTSDTTGITYEDIFISHKKDSIWGKAKSIGSEINTAGNEASVGISVDGQIIFIYKDSTDESGNIYMTHLKGNKWSTPIRLNENINTASWEPSAFMSADGNTLYFSSNREGGFGGRDLYSSKKLPNGEWAKAINLGATINTEFEEDAPFIHPDGRTLYFSSNGHTTMGGFDIFSSTLTSDQKWNAPVNIGFPINSPGDDIYYVVSPNNQRAYYSSFKEGGFGEKDNYMVTFKNFIEPPLTVLKGLITDPFGKVPEIVNITVTDNETEKVVGTYHTNSVSGSYLLILPPGKNYNVTYESDNFMFHSRNIDVKDNTNYFVIHEAIKLEPLVVGSKIILNNIFFDFDKATLRTQSNTELNKLYKFLIKYSQLIVEISGHTDSKGADQYNQLLSEKRAQAVVDFLITKGINKNQLVFKGYGETQPTVKNINPDGSDNPDNRQLNRRVELKIIGMDRSVPKTTIN